MKLIFQGTMKMFSSGVLWNLSNAKYSQIESNLDPVNKLDSFNAQKKKNVFYNRPLFWKQLFLKLSSMRQANLYNYQKKNFISGNIYIIYLNI